MCLSTVVYSVQVNDLIVGHSSAKGHPPGGPTPQKVIAIKTMLGISVVDGHDLYLGLPTFSLQSKRLLPSQPPSEMSGILVDP